MNKLVDIDKLLKCKTKEELIEKWFNMCYETKEELYIFKNSKKAKIEGGYIRHRKFEMKSCIDLFFKTCEKICRKFYLGQINSNDVYDDEFAEECNENGRFYALTALDMLFAGAYKKTLDKHNLKVETLEDFKTILQDEEQLTHLFAILYTSIKNMARKELYKHDNKGYYLEYYREDGVSKTRMISKKDKYLDEPLNRDEDGDSLYNKIASENEDMTYKIDEFKAEEEGLISYIANNKDKIFMKKQLDTLKKFDCDYNFLGAGGNNNRKQIKEGCYNSLVTNNKTDRFTFIKDGVVCCYRDKTFILFVEELLLADSKEQLELIASTLEKSTKLAEQVSEILYSLNIEVYQPIVRFLDNRIVDYKYINTHFKQFLYALCNEYNNKVQEKFEVGVIEMSSTEKIKFFLERNIMTKKLIARKENNLDIVTTKELIAKVNKLCNLNFTSIKQVNKFLMSLGYKINTETRTSVKNNISAYVISTFVEEKLEEVTQEQLDKIKNFVLSNLKNDVILACSQDCNYLRLCDVKKFIENLLCREYKTKDIIELLQSLNINIADKPSSKVFKDISDKRVSYYKVN